VTSFIIIDAQSVKNTETAEEKGYDGGKKVSGIKRHIAVDTQGLPHALAVTTANVSDKVGAKTMLGKKAEELKQVTNVLVDGGYNGAPFEEFILETLDATVEVAKRNELHTFKVIPKRWVVERSFGVVAGFGKTVNASSPLLWLCFSSHSFHFYSAEPISKTPNSF